MHLPTRPYYDSVTKITEDQHEQITRNMCGETRRVSGKPPNKFLPIGPPLGLFQESRVSESKKMLTFIENYTMKKASIQLKTGKGSRRD